MKLLHLLRHAKSSWDDAQRPDHDRPLSTRGKKTAHEIAAYLQEQKIDPDLVLCSTALRALQTLEPIAAALNPPKIVLDRALYEADGKGLLAYIARLDEDASCVLMIGHNPALQEFASALAEKSTGDRLPARDEKFPTGALASFRITGKWRAVKGRSAKVVSFVAPRDFKTAKG